MVFFVYFSWLSAYFFSTYCKNHSKNKWNKVSAQILLNGFKKHGAIDRRNSLGRPWWATSEENEGMIEDLICSQKENPWSHMSPREIQKYTGMSRLSVRRMVKRKGLKQFKRLKSPRWVKVREKEGLKEQLSWLNDSPKTLEALKNVFGRMKKILLLKFLSIQKTFVFVKLTPSMKHMIIDFTKERKNPEKWQLV